MSVKLRDFYAAATDAQPALQPLYGKVADAAEARFNDPRMTAVLREFISGIDFPEDAKVLETGCGVGGVVRLLQEWPNVGHVTGIDQSGVFIERARQLVPESGRVAFEEGDGRRTRFADGTFDVVIMHTVICHARLPEQLIDEAFRLLRPGGLLAICDADDASVATGSSDPLQACIEVLPVQNLGLVRRLPLLLRSSGFESHSIHNHGYVEDPKGGLMLSWVARGVDALVKLGRIGDDLAHALRAEAERRAAAESWFGHISFFSVVGSKP